MTSKERIAFLHDNGILSHKLYCKLDDDTINDKQKLIEFYHDNGLMPDRYYYMQNGKSAQENYTDYKQKQQVKVREALLKAQERELEKAQAKKLEKEIEKSLEEAIDKAVDDLLKGFNSK